MGTFVDSYPFLAITVSVTKKNVLRYYFAPRKFKVDMCLNNTILRSVFLYFRFNIGYQTGYVAVKSYRLFRMLPVNSHALAGSFHTTDTVARFFSCQSVILIWTNCKAKLIFTCKEDTGDRRVTRCCGAGAFRS